MEDKRLYPRVNTNLVVNCSRCRFNSSQPENFHVGYTDNLSLSGTKIVIPQEVETKDKVLLELQLDPYAQALKAQAEVVWYKSMITWGQQLRGFTEAGLRFEQDTISNLEQLSHFLNLKQSKA